MVRKRNPTREERRQEQIAVKTKKKTITSPMRILKRSPIKIKVTTKEKRKKNQAKGTRNRKNKRKATPRKGKQKERRRKEMQKGELMRTQAKGRKHHQASLKKNAKELG